MFTIGTWNHLMQQPRNRIFIVFKTAFFFIGEANSGLLLGQKHKLWKIGA